MDRHELWTEPADNGGFDGGCACERWSTHRPTVTEIVVLFDEHVAREDAR